MRFFDYFMIWKDQSNLKCWQLLKLYLYAIKWQYTMLKELCRIKKSFLIRCICNKIFSFLSIFCSYESKHDQMCTCLRIIAQCLRISTARVRSLWTSNVPILAHRSNWLRLEAVRYCELLCTWNCIKHSSWSVIGYARAHIINLIVYNWIGW